MKIKEKITEKAKRFPQNLIIFGLILIIASLTTSIITGKPILSKFEITIPGIASTTLVIGLLLIIISIPIYIAKKAEENI